MCGLFALAFGARDLYRVVTVPPYSPSLPEPLPVEAVNGFRNAYPFTYVLEMTDITAGNSKDYERWYTDRSGWCSMRNNTLQTSGKRAYSFSMMLDGPGEHSFGFAPTTHSFGFTISGLRDLPVGIAYGDDPTSGARAKPINDLIYAVIARGRYDCFQDGCWQNSTLTLTERYNIPKQKSTATVALGIASRSHAILYGEAPMPGWWGRKVGADLALKQGVPFGKRILWYNSWQERIVTVKTPELPTGKSSLAPYAFGVYAVTLDGKEHVMRIVEGCEGVGEAGYMCYEDIPRDRLSAIRILVAPYLWTRFENVPLHYKR